YCKTVAVVDGREKICTGSFNTADLGPRTIKLDRVYNARDIGGYTTASGKRTKQGLFYRGGSLTKSSDTAYDQWVGITEESAIYMRDVLKIKSDFDLRTILENLARRDSPIPDATLTYFGVSGYTNILTNETEKAKYKVLLQALSDRNNYPVYVHCTGGADRTGTICFLINALCGVSETDLIHDYEFTSFSIYNVRSAVKTREQGGNGFYEFYEQLRSDYEGDTLSEKVYNYMLSIGLTETEIDNIISIMFEGI
ncbi:MAG: tyrosine-protein phosphatase, partial [Clostridia bacterium]|nr:tyrosine-protein phosphatase [Clostridia bacterium]